MVAPRDSGWTSTGRSHDFMESILPPDAVVRRFSATAIRCPNTDCCAAPGKLCPGRDVLCPERVQLVISKIRDNDMLEVQGPVTIALVDGECLDCRSAGLNRKGRPLACHRAEHQCGVSRGPGASPCPRRKAPGASRCSSHGFNATIKRAT